MNELFILAELMEFPKNGYKLRNALQETLGQNRKISFGVLYPLLDKLNSQGMITYSTNNDGEGHSQKLATITEKGKKRFYSLMHQEIPNGAHSNELFLIKLDAMQHLPLPEQKELLEKYIDAQNQIIEHTSMLLEKLSQRDTIDHWYASQKFRLRLNQAKLTRDWANNFFKDI